MRILLLIATGVLAACATNEDPAAGGFGSGLRGIATGTYQDRIDERQGAVDAARSEEEALGAEQAAVAAETAAVEAQIADAQAELQSVRRDLVILRTRLSQAETPVDPALDAQVQAAVTAEPDSAGGEAAAADRLAALQKAISDTRSLVSQLSELSS